MTFVNLIGNVGRDAETVGSEDRPFGKFSIGTSQSDYGEKKEKTDWYRVVCKAALVPYITKGTRLYINGNLEQRAYEGKDGTQKVEMTIYASNIVFLSPKTEGQPTQTAQKPVAKKKAETPDEFVDEAPF